MILSVVIVIVTLYVIVVLYVVTCVELTSMCIVIFWYVSIVIVGEI